MTRIFSSLDLALNNIEDYMLAKETDIYLCQTTYPSGKEYSFREEKDISFQDSPVILRCNIIPLWHLFRNKSNALKLKRKFEQKYGYVIRMKRITYEDEYVYTLKILRRNVQ